VGSCFAITGFVRICKGLQSGFATIYKDSLGLARICQDLLGFTRICSTDYLSEHSHGFARIARICKDLRGIARICKDLQVPKMIRICKDL